MLILAATAAGASPVLLYAEDLPAAQRRAELDLGIAETAETTAAELLTDTRVHFVRTPPLARCGGEPTANARILQLIGEAEELRLAMRAPEALQRLEEGAAAWACLAEPADATLGARLHFLLGVTRFTTGDAEASRAAFRSALRSDPDLAWDPDTAPDARALFDEVRAEPIDDPVRVTLVPTSAELALRVDGRSVAPSGGQVALQRGLHLVQLAEGDRAIGLWVDLAEDDWLVLPQQVDDGLVRDIDDPRARRSIEGLAAAAGLEGPLLVPARRSTWMLHRTWQEHRPPFARRARGPFLASGALVLMAGGAWMAVEAAGGRDRLDQFAAGGRSTLAYQALVDRHAAGRTRFSAAGGVAGAGLAALAAGGVMWVVSW